MHHAMIHLAINQQMPKKKKFDEWDADESGTVSIPEAVRRAINLQSRGNDLEIEIEELQLKFYKLFDKVEIEVQVFF